MKAVLVIEMLESCTECPLEIDVEDTLGRLMMIPPVGGWTAYCKCETMVQSYEKYCSNCGQAFDWSGEEETSVKEESEGMREEIELASSIRVSEI